MTQAYARANHTGVYVRQLSHAITEGLLMPSVLSEVDKERVTDLAERMTDTFQGPEHAYKEGEVALAFVNAMRHMAMCCSTNITEYDARSIGMLNALTNCLIQGRDNYDEIKAAMAAQPHGELRVLN